MTTPSTIDLSIWKLTLPTGRQGSPDEFFGKELTELKDSDYFERLPNQALRFRAPVDGVTTKNSKNPRSELREMNADGSKADWSSSVGAHTLIVDEAFTHLPNARTDGGTAGLVGAQIHDSENDISVFRLEGTKLWVTKGNTTHHALADGNYELGTRCETKFVVYQDVVKAYYNGKLITTITGEFSDAYFKAGAYTQANSANSKPANSTNYGETVIYGLRVEHTSKPSTTPTAPVPPTPVPPTPVPPTPVPPTPVPPTPVPPTPVPPTPVPPPPVPPVPEPVPTIPPAPSTPDKVIMIMRHGDKPKSDRELGLSPDGKMRASKLVNFFTFGLVQGIYKPDRLYASYKSNKSTRSVDTLRPLADSLKLTINKRFEADEADDLGKELRSKSGVSLVAWAREEIPDIVKKLGTVTPRPPRRWPDNRFDVVWVFRAVKDGWSFYEVPQNLMPKDQNRGIGNTVLKRFLNRICPRR